MRDFPNIIKTKITPVRRLGQRTILPTGVKSRNLEGFIFGSETSGADGSVATTLGNGERAVLTSQLTQNDEHAIFGIPYITAYADSIADANTLPGGSAIDEADWKIIPPFYPFFKWEDTIFAKHIETAQMVVYNVSAGSTSVIFVVKWRYISPREGVS